MPRFVPFLKLSRVGYAHSELTPHAFVWISPMSIRTMVRYEKSTRIIYGLTENAFEDVLETPEQIIDAWGAGRHV